MADYNSEEDMPFDVENANTFDPYNFDPSNSAGGQEVDSSGFPISSPQMDSSGFLVPNEQVFQVDNSGFPIPLTPVTTATSTSSLGADRSMFSTPPRTKRSGKPPQTPDTVSSRQDAKDIGARGFANFDKGSEGTNNSTTHSDSSQADHHEKQSKRCQAFKTRSAIVIAVVLLLVLITILVVAVLFLSGEKVDEMVSPTMSTPLETTVPVASPSLGPTAVTSPPVSAPTGSAPTGSAPVPNSSLEAPIREFLFENSDVTVEPNKPVAQKAFDWLVDEANQAGSLAFPLDPKYLQRFGILMLYYSVNPNGQDSNSENLSLPSPLMRNQDECSWRGMECDENGMLTNIKLSDLGLDGTLPPEWGFFPNLKSIDMSKNQLVGFLPEGLYDSLGLEELYLYKNRFGGTISSKIGNLWELQRFHLGHNRLSGPIPPELASTASRVRKLRTFNVHRNQMTGTIPSNMRLRQLYYMDLGHNQFSGELPADLGTESVRLRHLYLDHNNFGGTFPSEILNAGDGRLKNLAVNDNQLVGTFPGDHDKSNSIMVELTIQNNMFDSMGLGLCFLDALTGGEMVEFNSDCSICQCRDTFLCRLCWQY